MDYHSIFLCILCIKDHMIINKVDIFILYRQKAILCRVGEVLLILLIMITVLLLIINPTKIHLVHNRKENYQFDHIPFNLKSIRMKFLLR